LELATLLLTYAMDVRLGKIDFGF